MGDHLLPNNENIEMSFYESGHCANNLISRYDKNMLKLNLQSCRHTPVEQAHERYRLHPNRTTRLANMNSPDVGLMRMVSPELEKFISNNTGLTPKSNVGSLNSPELSLFNLVSPEFEKVLASVQKTPTPTRLLRECNSSVSQQREAYMQGFVEALHHINNKEAESENVAVTAVSRSTAVSLSHSKAYDSEWTQTTQSQGQIHYQVSTMESLCEAQSKPNIGGTAVERSSEMNHLVLNPTQEHHFKMEESFSNETQNVPNQAVSNFLPMPPIDLEVQEIVKRERKKQKNRVAASKCRKKKLEREAQLEVRVQHLKEKNIELGAVANALRQQVSELKQRVLEHVAFGCQLPTEITTTAY